MTAPVFPVDCIAYCDESKYIGRERYRAISCVSIKSEKLEIVEGELRALLEEAEQEDLGFTDLTSTKNCIVATKMMRCAVEHAAAGDLQVRTIIWDAYDRRHGPGTDELRNMERMYVHLLRDVLGRRWPAKTWEVRPDEQSAIRWNAMARILEFAATKTAGRPIEVRHLEQQSSVQAPLVQVADLYAGLMSYYAKSGAAFVRLLKLPIEQQKRALAGRIEPLASGSDRERFKMLLHVMRLYGDCGIRTVLTNSGLVFGESVASVVFNWLYEPQHDEDKAPRRAEDEVIANYVYECVEPGCATVFEIHFAVEKPYCARHYRERNPAIVEARTEREDRREAERIYREGSHYCDQCGNRDTPDEGTVAEAEYIGKPPKCSVCGRRSLISMLTSSSQDDHNERLQDFELKHDDRYRR